MANILVALLIVLAFLLIKALNSYMSHCSLSENNMLTHYRKKSNFEEFEKEFKKREWIVKNKIDLQIYAKNQYPDTLVMNNLVIVDKVALKFSLIDFLKVKSLINSELIKED